jgi:hypothetical protein
MTVAELIVELQKYDPDLNVEIHAGDDAYAVIYRGGYPEAEKPSIRLVSEHIFNLLNDTDFMKRWTCT